MFARILWCVLVGCCVALQNFHPQPQRRVLRCRNFPINPDGGTDVEGEMEELRQLFESIIRVFGEFGNVETVSFSSNGDNCQSAMLDMGLPPSTELGSMVATVYFLDDSMDEEGIGGGYHDFFIGERWIETWICEEGSFRFEPPGDWEIE